MNILKLWRLISFLASVMVLNACSNEEILPLENNVENTSSNDKSALDFVATLTPAQQANLDNYGEVFLLDQQKDSWNTTIDPDIPATWGCFDSPFKESQTVQNRAVGIWGSYPAQYWTMIRLKNGPLDKRILNCMILAVEEMEAKTNVRFYNSSKDDEDFTVGGTTIKLPNVKVNMLENISNTEGAGNFGLIGGEQIIYVPKDLADTQKYTSDEVIAFLVHAFCNAAGMFNEQQRKDRDDYVQIYQEHIKESCKICFSKQSQNYTMQGTFDYHSITLASSKSYSKDGQNTIVKKGGGEIARNLKLSDADIYFLNAHYLPYRARTDNYIELYEKVYYNGRLLTESERIQLQNDLNAQRGLYGTPPLNGRIDRLPWS